MAASETSFENIGWAGSMTTAGGTGVALSSFLGELGEGLAFKFFFRVISPCEL